MLENCRLQFTYLSSYRLPSSHVLACMPIPAKNSISEMAALWNQQVLPWQLKIIAVINQDK